jgi:hypothetical protein
MKSGGKGIITYELMTETNHCGENKESLIKKYQDRNAYLEPQNYDKVQDKLKHIEINHIESDISRIDHILDDKFDIMLCSNMWDYKNQIFKEMFVGSSLAKILKPNGVAQIDYFHSGLNPDTHNTVKYKPFGFNAKVKFFDTKENEQGSIIKLEQNYDLIGL